jgi:VWFA-related protein
MSKYPCCAMAAFTLAAGALFGQTATAPATPPATPQQPAKTSAEMTTRDEPALFKARVNLVSVPVVVRDKAGNAIGNLKQEDFQLFDKGKPQYIARFSMESAAARLSKATGRSAAPKPGEPAPASDLPDAFNAYLFDDVHLAFGDLARVRDAARRQIDKMKSTDRVAIFTTSGQDVQDFTDNRDLLHDSLSKLRPTPITGQGLNRCPNMNYYMADMIQNKNDPQVLQAATADVMSCASMTDQPTAQKMAQQAASQELNLGDHETRVTLGVLKDVIRRMAAMPGQRSVIVVSPGFITLAEHSVDKTEVMDRAIRANVLINTLDARGLYTDTPDITRTGTNVQTAIVLSQMDRETARAQADVLAELAHGTGGNFFENNNDLDAGFDRLAAAPEYFYLLAFSPQNLKMDGSFHALKVTLKAVKEANITARRGYYAPRHLEDVTETARREVEEALFSREEMADIPCELHTQFFKVGDDKARVAVLIKVEVKRLKFRKQEDRNYNDLTVVAALFDRNGVYVTGNQKKIEMRLKDETVERKLDGGLTIRSSFDVKPGNYAVRLVVRDTEGQLMSAQNGVVEIPY